MVGARESCAGYFWRLFVRRCSKQRGKSGRSGIISYVDNPS